VEFPELFEVMEEHPLFDRSPAEVGGSRREKLTKGTAGRVQGLA